MNRTRRKKSLRVTGPPSIAPIRAHHIRTNKKNGNTTLAREAIRRIRQTDSRYPRNLAGADEPYHRESSQKTYYALHGTTNNNCVHHPNGINLSLKIVCHTMYICMYTIYITCTLAFAALRATKIRSIFADRSVSFRVLRAKESSVRVAASVSSFLLSGQRVCCSGPSPPQT